MIYVIEKAIEILKNSGVVAIPTETVYGLAADSTDDLAISSIYEIKGRPSFNPLISHVACLDSALKFGKFSEDALKLAQAFWHPGFPEHRPLTIIVNVKEDAGISKLSTAGLDTIGIRVPDHLVTIELLKAYPNPLSAPSANLSQKISATNAEIVRQTLGSKIPLVIDGGQCRFGLESTIVDMSGPKCTILRYGGTTIKEIEKILGYSVQQANLGEAIKAPGMLKKHYAPSIPLEMNRTEAIQGGAFLGFGRCDYGEYNLSKSGNLKEAASNLFKMLFELDNPSKYSAIYVAPVPMEGLGIAINDRLQRAAAK
jgi:L-threonylcarbamoyladenylate synthase